MPLVEAPTLARLIVRQEAARLHQTMQPLAAADNRWTAVFAAEAIAREVMALTGRLRVWQCCSLQQHWFATARVLPATPSLLHRLQMVALTSR